MRDRALQVIDNNNDGIILDLKIDPIRDSDGRITRGLVIGNTLNQNKAFLLMANLGEFKYMPNLGVGFKDGLLGSEPDLLLFRHRIREQFAFDGLNIINLQLYASLPVKIEAEYENN